MTDKAKLELFESWLLDDGQEEKNNKYEMISVAVESNGYIRIYTTQSFSTRAIVTMLGRYNPEFKILAAKYGEFLTKCPKWTSIDDFRKIYKEEERENLLNVTYKYTREEMLQWYDYRTAINLFYIECAREGKYPSKNPFKGVKLWKEEDIPMTVRHYPFFVSDGDNELGADVLRYFDGKRISRYLNGEKVEGYLLSAPRIIEEN